MDRLVKHVRVVGEGVSGLPAASEGLAVTVMEQRRRSAATSAAGGEWLYDPSTDGGDPLGARALVKVH